MKFIIVEGPEGFSFRVLTMKAKILGKKVFKTRGRAESAARRYIFDHNLRATG